MTNQTQAKHTPGPWNVHYRKDKQCLEIHAKSDREGQLKKFLAIIVGTDYPDELNDEAQANAVEALEEVIVYSEELKMNELHQTSFSTNLEIIFKKAKQAISKAEGETQ